jgi:hypothetical protein
LCFAQYLHKPSFEGGREQGDQIGRIFAYILGVCLLWAVFWQLNM